MKRFLTVLVALMLVGLAGPAQAAAKGHYCTYGRICFFDGFNYTSLMWDVDASGGSGCYEMPWTLDNRTSSISSDTPGYRWIVYTGDGCTGWREVVYDVSDGNMNSNWNNVIDSVRRCGYYDYCTVA